MKEKLEAIMDALEEKTGATWIAHYDPKEGGQCEISTYSPAGENVIINLCGDTIRCLAHDAFDALEAYDADDHASEILYYKNHGHDYQREYYAAAPDSLRALLEDAEAIGEMYRELANALEAAA